MTLPAQTSHWGPFVPLNFFICAFGTSDKQGDSRSRIHVLNKDRNACMPGCGEEP